MARRHNADDDWEIDVIDRRQFSNDEYAEHAAALLGAGGSGPVPPPDWLITHQDAEDIDLGILKTGKEAVVSLIERTFGEDSHLLARKTYRDPTRRAFHRESRYRAQRSRRRGEDRIFKASGVRGAFIRAAEWRQTEFTALADLWLVGVPVPYPVEMTAEDILMEYVGDDNAAAPRLASLRPGKDELLDYWDQTADGIARMYEAGWVHGDLSAYNILVHAGQLWFIDFPQAAPVARSAGWSELLLRDVTNVCDWFRSRGLDRDPGRVVAEVIGAG